MKWIEVLKSTQESKIRLLCCHYAGGGASMFYQWIKHFPEYIELMAIQLPGRESRFKEPLLKNMEEVVGQLLEAFKLLTVKPFLLFGHSLGSLICFELARSLQDLLLPIPKHLIVSGCRAPHIPFQRKHIRNLPDHEFRKKIMEYNGIPKEIYDSQSEILELILPIARADFAISETYQYIEKNPLACNITAISGQEDPMVYEPHVQEWNSHTCLNFNHISVPGNHFFIKSAQSEIINVLKQIITPYVNSRS